MTATFWALAAERPDAIAVVEPDGREVPAGALLAEINRLSHALGARGVASGDVIAYAMANRGALLEVYLAAMQLGLYVTPISTSLTAGEVAYILRDSGAKAVFCDASTAATVGAACDEAGTPRDACIDVDAAAYAALKAPHPAIAPAHRRMGAPLFYTSGTTGRPKGVRRPLRVGPPEEVLASEGYLGLFGIHRFGGEVHLVCAPLYHGAAINWCADHLHLGHTVVLLDKWTPDRMLDVIEARRVTAALVVPTHFSRLLALPADERARDVSSLRHVIHTGAPCAVDVKQAMLAWWGPVIYEIYAASEGAATMVSPAEWLARPGTVGKPLPYSRVRVLRPDGSDCAPREPGAVYIRQAGARFEYHDDPAKTESARRGAFFTVGDIGYLDEDGYLYLCDRASEVIISGGVNVYPTEVEQALATHAGVADVAVIGAPDDEWGEQVRAIVELAPGVAGSPALADELIAHCRARLAAFKCPRAVEFVPRLPRDDNGKLYRRTLRDAAWAGRARRI